MSRPAWDNVNNLDVSREKCLVTIQHRTVPSEFIKNIYERRASMSSLGKYSKGTCAYSNPLNVLPNGIIIGSNSSHSTIATENGNSQLDKSQQTEEEDENSDHLHDIDIDNINRNIQPKETFVVLSDQGRKGTRMRTHQGNSSQMYKDVLHKSQMQVLNEWMNTQLRHRLDDVNIIKGSYDDKTEKGKISRSR